MTPTEQVQNEIDRFLSTKDPEVLCISGEWGVGKTYNWQTRLDNAKRKEKVGLERYAYVSLFGINSLEGLKLATFENSEFFKPKHPDGIVKRVLGWAWKLFKKSKPAAALVPQIADLLERAGPLFFSTVSDQIICIDDLERRSGNLTVAEVLGLTSYLKEQRKCKVVLLLNDKELGEADEGEFKEYQEKVVDVFLTFAPEPKESAQIALPGDDIVSKKIAEFCTTLRIANIRVIKKIERFVRIIEPLVTKFDEKVFHQAVHSLTLLGWSKYQPNSAPPLEYLRIKRGNEFFGLDEAEEVPPEEAARKALLDAYGFVTMDEFDLALLEGVENGFFDPELIEKHAAKLDKAFEVQAQEGSYKDAWSTYHGSFDCNDKEVTDTLYASFKKNIQIIAPINLSGTVRLFKELGRSDEAEELVQLYVMEREENREFWDLSNHVFPGDKVDPDVEKAFEKKVESFIAKFDPVAVLLKIAEQDSWHTHDVQKLASLSSDDYYNIFKSRSGSDLTSVVKAALQFGRIGNATPPMQEIFNRAREALARIGKECPINARRVRKYGIEVAEGDVAPGIAAAPDPAEG